MRAAAEWRALGCAARLVVTDPRRLDAARTRLEQYLDAVDAVCSRFRSDSELVRLGRAHGRTVEVSPLLADALGAALHAAEATGGDVDPTVGSAMSALGYDRDFRLVERQGLPAALLVGAVPGWRQIRLDQEALTVTVPEGVRLDLGATAKAWAADRAAAVLAAEADCGVLVSLGGDTAVAGRPPEGGWRIRVQDSTDTPAAGPYALIALHDGGLATSGTSARRWTRGGRQLHHIVDPRTGRPAATPWRTVSVAAASCLDANAASTAAVVRGAAAADWLAGQRLPARLVSSDGAVRTVAGWPEDAERVAA